MTIPMKRNRGWGATFQTLFCTPSENDALFKFKKL